MDFKKTYWWNFCVHVDIGLCEPFRNLNSAKSKTQLLLTMSQHQMLRAEVNRPRTAAVRIPDQGFGFEPTLVLRVWPSLVRNELYWLFFELEIGRCNKLNLTWLLTFTWLWSGNPNYEPNVRQDCPQLVFTVHKNRDAGLDRHREICIRFLWQ